MPAQLPSFDIQDTAASLGYGIIYDIKPDSDVPNSVKKMIGVARGDYQKLRAYLTEHPTDQAGIRMECDLLSATAAHIEATLFFMMRDEEKIPDLSHITRALIPPYENKGALVEAMLLYNALDYLEKHISRPDQAQLIKNNTEWQNIRDIVASGAFLGTLRKKIRETLGDYHAISAHEILRQHLPQIMESIGKGEIIQDNIVKGRKTGEAGTLSQLQNALNVLEQANEAGIDVTAERDQIRKAVTAIVEIVKNAPPSDLSESAIRKGDSLLLAGRNLEDAPSASPKYGSYFIAQLRRLCSRLEIPSVPRGGIIRDDNWENTLC